MAVSVNATGTKLYTGTPGTSINYTGLTVAAGSNTAIVGLLFVDSTTNISGVTATWDSGGTPQAMTQLIEKDNAGGGGANAVYIFGLAGEHGAIATGNKTLNVSWTGSQRTFFVAMAFDGVDQAGGAVSFRNPTAAAGGVGTVATIPVISATGNKVIALESAGVSQGTSTGTLIFEDHTSGAVINAMCQYDDGAASVTIGNSGGNASIAAIDILAASSFIADGGARFRQRWNRLPLAYPAGAVSGIDPSHPAASGVLMSAVAVPGGALPSFKNLITGKVASGTNAGAVGSALDGAIGPSGFFQTADAPANLGAGPGISQANQTFACIAVPKTIGAAVYNGYVLVFNGTFNHSGIYVVGNQVEYFGSSDVFSGLNLANDVPYFIAASITLSSAAADAAVFVVKNLATGAIQTSRVSGNTTSRTDNSVLVGGDTGNECAQGRIAAAMYSDRRMSLQQLVAWAADPWSFWYPNNFKEFATAGATPPPPTIITPSRTLMGVGT